jgi:Zn2+/Cd2+-exporting ATPase
MSEVQLNLTLLLPGLDAGDQCTHLLTDRLAGIRGVHLAHIVNTDDKAELCLHYDPNLVPLAKLERLAYEAGAQINQAYRHETVPFTGLDAADSADGLARALAAMPGMIHAK